MNITNVSGAHSELGLLGARFAAERRQRRAKRIEAYDRIAEHRARFVEKNAYYAGTPRLGESHRNGLLARSARGGRMEQA